MGFDVSLSQPLIVLVGFGFSVPEKKRIKNIHESKPKQVKSK